VRLIIARCSVDYSGRLNTHLPLATRLIMIKADGTVAFHRDIQHAPLNWMSPRAPSPSRRRMPSRRRPA
jgi:RecB family endonuclease NucS